MNNQPGSWKIRRRYMFTLSAFCIIVISYTLYNDLDSTAANTAVNMSFVTLISIVGSYVFGAAWDDKNARDAGASSVTRNASENIKTENIG